MENDRVPQLLWDHELTTNGQAQPLEWIWDGFVARGSVTLLTSAWKAGKTTLVSLLLARRALAQSGTLAGLAVQPGKSVIITEEDRRLWGERASRHGFGGQVCFFPQPFRAIPGPAEWQALIERILRLRDEHGIDLLVVDPLAHFVRCENNAASILESIMPLRELTRRGMAVLVLHHPSKSQKSLGHGARGSGALLGHADVIIEMRHPGGDPSTRRRRFIGSSRYQRTPARLLLELSADATDYLPMPDPVADDFTAQWHVANMVLEDAPQKLTRRDILLEWPEDFDRPDPSTLLRWLNRALERQLILREGTGRKTDPFRYWLPAREAVWKEGILYDISQTWPFTPLHPKERDEPRQRPSRDLDHKMDGELTHEMDHEACYDDD